MTKDYVEIGEHFTEALNDVSIDNSFKNAISGMKNYPHLVEKISAWDEMVWLCVEEFLNSGQMLGPGQKDHFTRACALLEL